MDFKERLAQLLNEFSWDAKTNTADHVLAEEIETLLQSRIVAPEEPPVENPGPVVPIGDPSSPGGN